MTKLQIIRYIYYFNERKTMKRFPFEEAKKEIVSICKAADMGAFDTREKFMEMVAKNPYLAVQGYNAFGKIFFWNTASATLYGQREEEAVNQDLVELIIPPEMRSFARAMISNAQKTGKMPDPSACDLLLETGKYVTVFSGHVVFSWENASTPEFYCVDLPIEIEAELQAATEST